MSISSTQPSSQDILGTRWTSYHGVEVRLRLATQEEKDTEALRQQSWSTWAAETACHYGGLGYNAAILYWTRDFSAAVAPWASDPFHYTLHLPGRIIHGFHHPAIMQEFFKHFRHNPGDPLAPFVENEKKIFRAFLTGIFSNSDITENDIILSAEKDNNVRLRNTLHTYFSGPKIKRMREDIQQVVGQTISSWKIACDVNGEVNLNRATGMFSMSVISKLFLGLDGPYDELYAAVKVLFADLNLLALKNIINDSEESRQAKEVLLAAIDKTLNSQTDEHSLVKAMSADEYTPNQVRAMILVLIMAGFENSANSLAWILLGIAQDPDSQDKIVKEIREGDVERPLYERARSIPSINTAINKGLKEFVPAWGIGRQVRDDLVLEIEGPAPLNTRRVHYIHKGETITAFPKFAAQAYSGSLSSLQAHSLPWSPFGLGKHLCPGMDLTLWETSQFIASILDQFVLQTKFEGQPRQIGGFVSSIVDKIDISLVPRPNSSPE